jgi:hypothetical protein
VEKPDNIPTVTMIAAAEVDNRPRILQVAPPQQNEKHRLAVRLISVINEAPVSACD